MQWTQKQTQATATNITEQKQANTQNTRIQKTVFKKNDIKIVSHPSKQNWNFDLQARLCPYPLIVILWQSKGRVMQRGGEHKRKVEKVSYTVEYWKAHWSTLFFLIFKRKKKKSQSLKFHIPNLSNPFWSFVSMATPYTKNIPSPQLWLCVKIG